MKVITDIKEWQHIRNHLPNDLKIGFVPTMGCLHQGHTSLIKNSVEKNNITVLSVFINPTQFNDPADYERYPKTLDTDIEMARQLGVNYVITPDIDSLYPNGNHLFLETDHPFSKIMEGQYRPGHFSGVLTIVMKLLVLIRANNVYFGQKDYQQYFLIAELIQNYFIQTDINLCATIREASGLPFSSRNTKLSTDERKTIETFYEFFYRNHPHSLTQVIEKIAELKMTYDYLEVHNNRLFFALRVGPIRIIDNIADANLYIHTQNQQVYETMTGCDFDTM